MTTTNDYSDLITERARHFGRGDRHGSWLFAADAACCVRRNGRGRPRDADAHAGKITATGFADLAGCSRGTVTLYLAAWDRAAREGLVDPADSLTPGSEPELPDASRWDEFYGPARLEAHPSEHPQAQAEARARAQAPAEAAEPGPGERREYRPRTMRAWLADADRSAQGAVRSWLADPRTEEAAEGRVDIIRIRGIIDGLDALLAAVAGEEAS